MTIDTEKGAIAIGNPQVPTINVYSQNWNSLVQLDMDISVSQLATILDWQQYEIDPREHLFSLDWLKTFGRSIHLKIDW